MAQEPDNTESKDNQQQRELDGDFLDWLGTFGPDASIDDLAVSLLPVVDAAKDPQA